MTILNSLIDKKLVILDLDGTIIDLVVDWSQLKRNLSNKFAEDYKINCDFKSISKCLSEIVKKKDEDNLKKFFKMIEEYETRNIDKSIPIEETKYFINNLKKFGIKNDVKLAVMSLNTKKTIEKALLLTDLTSKIDYIVGREDVRNWKPNPEGLLKILEKLNIDKSEALFIGDMEKDLIAGERAGIEAYLIDDLKNLVNEKRTQ